MAYARLLHNTPQNQYESVSALPRSRFMMQTVRPNVVAEPVVTMAPEPPLPDMVKPSMFDAEDKRCLVAIVVGLALVFMFHSFRPKFLRRCDDDEKIDNVKLMAVGVLAGVVTFGALKFQQQHQQSS